MMVESAPAPRRGLGPLWAMAVIFGLPFVAAVFFYLHPEWLPEDRANRGQLLDPPVATTQWSLRRLDGHPLALSEYTGSWLLVTAADPACGPVCQARLYELHQVRRATGVERVRVERLALFPAPPSQELANALHAGDPQLLLGVAPAGPALLDPPFEPGAVVIVDPMGNAMMYYAPAAPAKSLLKDVKHLLRISQDWRLPGS